MEENVTVTKRRKRDPKKIPQPKLRNITTAVSVKAATEKKAGRKGENPLIPRGNPPRARYLSITP